MRRLAMGFWFFCYAHLIAAQSRETGGRTSVWLTCGQWAGAAPICR